MAKQNKRIKQAGIMVLGLGMGLLTLGTSMAASDSAMVKQRIAPEGQVHVADNGAATKAETPTATDAAKTAAAPAKADAAAVGEKVYNEKCSVCHAAGVAGAPKYHDAQGWKSRADKGMAAMLDAATKGIGAMPPKGTCMNCTPQELTDAIKYMLPPDMLKNLKK